MGYGQGWSDVGLDWGTNGTGTWALPDGTTYSFLSPVWGADLKALAEKYQGADVDPDNLGAVKYPVTQEQRLAWAKELAAMYPNSDIAKAVETIKPTTYQTDINEAPTSTLDFSKFDEMLGNLQAGRIDESGNYLPQIVQQYITKYKNDVYKDSGSFMDNIQKMIEWLPFGEQIQDSLYYSGPVGQIGALLNSTGVISDQQADQLKHNTHNLAAAVGAAYAAGAGLSALGEVAGAGAADAGLASYDLAEAAYSNPMSLNAGEITVSADTLAEYGLSASDLSEMGYTVGESGDLTISPSEANDLISLANDVAPDIGESSLPDLSSYDTAESAYNNSMDLNDSSWTDSLTNAISSDTPSIQTGPSSDVSGNSYADPLTDGSLPAGEYGSGPLEAATSGTSGTGFLDGLTLKDALTATAIGTMAAGALAPTGGQTVSQNSTTSSGVTGAQQSAEKVLNDYIDNFYGLNNTGKSAESRLAEDTSYLKNLANTYNTSLTNQSNKYLQQTKDAKSPYNDLLTKAISDAQGGTGNFAKTNVLFGGDKVFDFVPKSNLNLSNNILNYGQNQAALNQGVADLENSYKTAALSRDYDTGATYTPNKTENDYSTKLEDTLKMLAGLGTTSTTSTSGTVPGASTWSNILSGINAGANLYSKLNPYTTNSSTTLASLLEKLGIS